MKIIPFLWAFGLVIGISVRADILGSSASANETTYSVAENGLNYRVWQKYVNERGPNGQVIPRAHRVTELASGLYYEDNGQLLESQDLIEPYADGAVAQHGQFKVIFANDLNTEGSVDMQTPDGKRLRSNIIGLAYYDRSSGQTVFIGTLQDSYGELISDNQVLYPNAFEGVKANVRYTYTKDKFEQDVILQEQPAAPETYGLNSGTTELEVVTEFIDPPTAKVQNVSSAETEDSGLEPDQGISWGVMCLGRGQSLDLGSSVKAVVAKQYVTLQGRIFLIEKVRLKAIVSALNQLPEQASIPRKQPMMASLNVQPPPTPAKGYSNKPIKMALNSQPQTGFILDYVALNNSYTNFTFKGDTTYYISGNLNLYGTNTFEGDTVIKFASGASIVEASSPFTPKIVFKSAAYRPVVFTSKDDNNIGEGFGSGSPSGGYGNPMLSLASAGNQTLSDFRMCYANIGISAPGTSLSISNAQFVNSRIGISFSSSTNYLGNVLFASTLTNFSFNNNVNINAQNVTFSKAFLLAGPSAGTYTNCSLSLTNCIFVYVTNTTTRPVQAGYNGFYATTPFGATTQINGFYPFKVTGAGSCYLTNGTTFVDTGTTNINVGLRQLLLKRTVFSPIVYSSATISTATTFTNQATRDTNTPDLGYHYDPIDYAFGNTTANANLTFTPGTAAGWFYTSGGGTWALILADSVTASFDGTATTQCHWIRYSTVQEGCNGNWTPQSWLGGMTGESYTHAAPALTARFTMFSAPSGEAGCSRDDYGLFVLNATDCEFYNPEGGGYYASVNETNCLFVNGGPGLWDNYGAANMTLENCTFIGGNLTCINDSGESWPFRVVNTAFDQTTFSVETAVWPTTGYYSDYNSFSTGAAQLPYLGSHDVVVTNSYNWQTSWLGNYYQATNSPLIRMGDAPADIYGLYEFTTQTNQIEETNSIVDIGYHYVAVDTNGNPLETMTNNMPDYLFDSNGNGLPDAWELKYFGNLNDAGSDDYEGDGFNNLYKYKNSLVPTNFITAQLEYWPFDNTNSWPDTNGDVPLEVQNILGIPSWDTNAALIDSTNLTAFTYSYVKPGGNANITCRQGTIQLWFKPDWTTAPILTNAITLTNGILSDWSFSFTIQGPTNDSFLVFASLDLQNWTQIDQDNDDLGVETYDDMGSGGLTNCFYYVTDGTLRSQIYGFEKDSIVPGFNWVARQTVATADDSLNTVFTNSDLPNGTELLLLGNDPSDPSVNSYHFSAGAWEPEGTDTLPLGQLAAMMNPSSNSVTVAFIGTVPEVPRTDPVAAFWNYGQSTASASGGIGTVASYFDNDFDMIYQDIDEDWNFTGEYLSYDGFEGYYADDCVTPWFDGSCNYLGPWFDINLYNPVSEPQVNPGEIFMIYNQQIQTYAWSQSTPLLNTGGPGASGRLVELGGYTPDMSAGWWSLYITPSGQQMSFGSYGGGNGQNNLTAGVDLTSNLWCQIVLTYTPTNSLLYLNGAVLTNGLGPVYYPSIEERYHGINFGTDTGGMLQVRGVIDDLATFNYPLSSTTISNNYQTAANLDSSGDGTPNILANELGFSPYLYHSFYGLNSTNALQVFTPLR